MNINRHNYEEYFLLYIDNELSVDQKKQVELFVQENPDLEEELVMLKQSRLIPDDSIVFDKKHLLMKEENMPGDHSFINLNNYEQWLIMYVDDELSAEEKLAVEKFAATHEHVQQELELFQQTKLQPEEIVFANKEVLYKKERTVRVISMQWWKVAVAAILVLSAGITLYSIFNKATNKESTPDNIAKKEETSPAVRTTEPNTDDQAAVVAKHDEKLETVTNPIDEQLRKDSKRQEKPVQENNEQLAYNAPVNTSDIPEPKIVGIDKTTIEEARVKDEIAFETHKENIYIGDVTIAGTETPDNSTKPDEAIQYASNAENKKFRGFFRKATRILERTTSINAADDDNKVLIGGMAINLK